MADKLKTVTIQHELLHDKEKKSYAKLLDRDFKVKVVWKTGVYDDEALVTGYPDDVSKAVSFHNTNNA